MTHQYDTLVDQIQGWARELGFQQVGITDTDLGKHEDRLLDWLARGYHGEMSYMAERGTMRSRPSELLPGTIRVISVRMDYLPKDPNIKPTLADGNTAYVSRYALGRDYHKLIRNRLTRLARKIQDYLEEHEESGFAARAFTDSAPILEKALAEKSSLGWIGKNTLLLNQEAGSWFFLGEILTNLPLPVTSDVQENQCGACQACIKACPTGAITAPYTLDARRCISYLTIEHRGTIDPSLRPLMGNRIFGCDDCQAVCPWNRYANPTAEADFSPRNSLDSVSLLSLFEWSEAQFLKRTEGSAIRRTGFDGWLRNIAIALGNADYHPDTLNALQNRKGDVSEMVSEHIEWAVTRQLEKKLKESD